MKPILLSLLFFLGAATGLLAQNRTITGTVKDKESNEPMIGANILVKGTSNGTATDIDGRFSLEIPAGQGLVLEVSSTGYLTTEVAIGASNTMDILLEVDAETLEEVVVIGYGEVKKSNVTGAIVSVKTEDLKKVPTTNVMESLQGKLPGVDITRSSGAAGAGINVVVRGNRSLSASNAPLFIVDGIQYNSIQDLNPNDIQSMEVLKDAASTAIFGSRGANGVILVTTKKGAAGKTRISFNSYAGVSQVTGYPNVFTPQEYANFRREANRSTGKWASAADDSKIFNAYELDRIQNNGGAIWPELFLRDGSQQEYQLGIATGIGKSSIYLSGNYFKEQGLFNMDDLGRYTFRFNMDHALSDKLKIGTQNQFIYYDLNARRDPLNIANKINPLLEPYENGSLVVYPNNGKDINPLSDEVADNYENNTRTTRIFTSAYLEYKPVSGLNLRSNLGFTLANGRNGIYRAAATVDRNGSAPEAFYRTDNSVNLTWENIANYGRDFGDHSLSVTGVTSLITNRNEVQEALGRNQLLSYQLFYALGNSTQEVGIYSNYQESALVSFTGRLQYDFKDKYILMVTGRQDGSSKLAEGNKWAFFPSASLAWRIKEENFLSGTDWLSNLKLRASFGIAGSDAVSPYSSESSLARIPFSYDEKLTPGYTFAQKIGNPNLKWELSTTYNLGLDFGILNNRLFGSVDLYDTRTSDLLLDRFLPLTSGVGYITENIGKTRNRGVEVALTAVVADKKNFQWNAGITWFANKEEIVELATGANDIANGWFIGQPTQAYYDFEKIGIWQSNEVDEATKYKQAPGDIRVKDQNGDGVIDANNDRIIIGSNRPKWSGNLTSDFKILNFDFSFQVFARIGQKFQYEYASVYDPAGVENSLQHDFWTPENASNDYPRPNASRSRIGTLYFTSLTYEDGSFIKLRGMTLGYTIPEKVLSRFGVSSLRLYVNGRNLLVSSKIKDYDPERGGSLSNPIPRLIVGGINLDF